VRVSRACGTALNGLLACSRELGHSRASADRSPAYETCPAVPAAETASWGRGFAVHSGRGEIPSEYALTTPRGTLSVHLLRTLGLPLVHRWYTPVRDAPREVESPFFQQSCRFFGPRGINESARDGVLLLKASGFSTLLVHPRATSESATRPKGPLRRGCRERGYKSAALPTELRRPLCPIPRMQPSSLLYMGRDTGLRLAPPLPPHSARRTADAESAGRLSQAETSPILASPGSAVSSGSAASHAECS